MRYFVVVMSEEDDGPGQLATPQFERQISKALTWDSPIPVVEVEMHGLRHGLSDKNLERLGLK